MLLRCELAGALRKWMTRERLTQAQAAKRLGVVQLYYKVRPLSLQCQRVWRYARSVRWRVRELKNGISGSYADQPKHC